MDQNFSGYAEDGGHNYVPNGNLMGWLAASHSSGLYYIPRILMEYMRAAGYTWTDYKTNTETAK
jgi:hypothetical protein